MRAALVIGLGLVGCQEYTVGKEPPVVEDPAPVCEFEAPGPEVRPMSPACAVVEPPPGGFRPIVEWGAGRNESCRGMPVVGDLDGDGLAEVVANFTGLLPATPGDLVVLAGDGSGPKWRRNARLGYGSSFALGDLDGDGRPEIVGVTTKSNQGLGLAGTYAAVAYSGDGTKLWESDTFDNDDFDYATAPIISDMNHDGSPEIVVGRVILNPDGTLRGKGNRGRGSWGKMPGPGGGVSEASVPAVTDLDLDGQEEVIVGDARYDVDGNTIWSSRGGGILDVARADGMIGIANLDDDPEGEVVVSSYATVRALDTDGRLMWGPIEPENANIVSPSAIADIDGDGYVEIIVAGGNQLIALNHDGTELWSVPVVDQSGATGASIFDFEGDGIPEVVYIDEVQMMALDGATGQTKFYTDEHRSDTMMDYPVIADVDNDEHAEIVVCHANFGRAISVYGDEDNSWRPARAIWNQHAYSITNIADDFSIPAYVPPSFTVHNTWHSALSQLVSPGGELVSGPVDVGAQLLGHCDTSCFGDVVEVYGRVVNASEGTLEAGTVTLSLYAFIGETRILVGTAVQGAEVPPESTGGDVTFQVPIDIAIDADRFDLVADDLGGGLGVINECVESNNVTTQLGALCLEEDR